MKGQCKVDISSKHKLRKGMASNHAANQRLALLQFLFANYLLEKLKIYLCFNSLVLHTVQGLVSIVKDYQLMNSTRCTNSGFLLNSSYRTLSCYASYYFLIISYYFLLCDFITKPSG